MSPGDQHEQFYRYSLVYNNAKHGFNPYYSGYQFASSEFSEGLIFFPFTAIVGLAAFFVGPIAAYNALLLASYMFVGAAGYLMAFQLTRSRWSGVIVGTYLATVPFRTSFLYGQMVFGVDAVLLPLLIYFIERARTCGDPKALFPVGLSACLLLTANFQLAYWALFLLSPYVLYAARSYGRVKPCSASRIYWSCIYIAPGAVAFIVYGFYIYSLMQKGVLSDGQNYAEVLFYAPEPWRLFNTFNGNEKNVYLGWSMFLVIPWSLWATYQYSIAKLLAKTTRAVNAIMPIMVLTFLGGLLLVFGPYIGKATGLAYYEALFHFVPGFSGTRTTGRIMGVVVVVYSILIAFCAAYYIKRLYARCSPSIAWMAPAATIMFIVVNFAYTKPGMMIVDYDNRAYEAIGTPGAKVVNLPFQWESDHYLNSTFLPYASRYNLRLLTGHSSLYPAETDEIVRDLYTLNSGILSYNQWEWLANNGYQYVVAHATPWPPHISVSALAGLLMSPYLALITDDEGVYLFRVVSFEDTNKYKSEEDVPYTKIIGKLELLQRERPALFTCNSQQVEYAYNWHVEEVYPGQAPFRWMNGTQSALMLKCTSEAYQLTFEYKPPPGTTLAVRAHGAQAAVTEIKLHDGWVKANVKLSDIVSPFTFVELRASQIFRAPPDTRAFGVMVRNISLTSQ
jgi:hypothetical protein